MRRITTIGYLAALLFTLASAAVPDASAAPGQLYGFGENAAGQLGSSLNNGSEAPNPVPAAIVLSGAEGQIAEEAAGGEFSLALSTTGQLFAFGSNRFGQLGVARGSGTAGANPTPEQVSLPGVSAHVTEIAAGFGHSLALTAAGELYSFGSNESGQLGRAENSGSELPNRTPERVELPLGEGSIVQIAAGYEQSLALTSAGLLYSWGGNRYGQLGRAANSGSETPNPIPAPVALPEASGPVVQIAAGHDHSLALTAAGQLYSFGGNRFGQLGRSANIETTNPNPIPVRVGLPGLVGSVVAIAAGGYHSLALSSSGQIYAFGLNEQGQLGNAASNGSERANPVPSPVTLPGSDGRPIAIAAGALHSLAVTTAGALYSFGSNAEGQLGRTATSGSEAANPSPTPVTLPFGETVDAVAQGSTAAFTLAQTADLAVLNSTLPPGQVGVPYAAEALAAGGGGGSYTWSASGLPPGLSLDPRSGRITGTPTLAGAGSVILTATDAFGVSATSAPIVLTIAPAIPPRAFLSTVLTEAQLRASLRQQLGMKGRAARIATLRKRGRFPFGFTALTAGTLSIRWYYLPPGTHLAQRAPVLVAAGGTSFRTAGTKTVVLKLTRAGHKLLRRHKRLTLVVKGTFTPTGKRPVTATKAFAIAR